MIRLDKKYKSLLESYGINTPLRIANFMAQIEHESGFLPIEEGLYYTKILSLRNAFHTPFKNKTDEFVKSFLKSQKKLANYVYANRMGNSGEASGEGYKYRGRGFIQITGKENYFRLQVDTDLPVLKNPDLLLEEANSMLSACWFWNLKGLNILADKDLIEDITKRINGGYNGIEHRKELLKKWKKELKI